MTIDASPAHNGISYRLALGPEDQEILSQIHYIATYYPAAERGDFVPTRTHAMLNPDFNRYYESWGRPGDIGIIAGDEDAELTVGAAWYRKLAPEERVVGEVEMAAHEVSIGVVPDYQNRGIGKTMLRALMAEAAGQGAQELGLGVNEHNVRALALYRSVSFIVVGRFRDDFIMRATLPATQE